MNIVYYIFIPLILPFLTREIELRSISKLYPKLRPDSADGYFYIHWLGIALLINIITFVFSIMIYDNMVDIVDPNIPNFEAYGFNVFLSVYILLLITISFNKIRKQFINRKFFNFCYSIFLLILPSLIITTLFYFSKMINEIILAIILFISTIVLCVLGLINFRDKYDIYPCELVNILLNDGSKIREIKCSDIKVTNKWLIINKKCNKTYLDLNVVVRIDCFGEEFRIDYRPVYYESKLFLLICNMKN